MFCVRSDWQREKERGRMREGGVFFVTARANLVCNNVFLPIAYTASRAVRIPHGHRKRGKKQKKRETEREERAQNAVSR
jgi:hypothetical protein